MKKFLIIVIFLIPAIIFKEPLGDFVEVKVLCYQASSGDYQTQDSRKLSLVCDKYNNTVAHSIAKNIYDWEPNDEEILKLKTKNGFSVAHILAGEGLMRSWRTNDESILRLANYEKETVAHFLAKNRVLWRTDNKSILKLVRYDGWTVAHLLARRNPLWTTYEKDILTLDNTYGTTVVDLLIFRPPNRYSTKWTTTDKSILNFRDASGESVAEKLAKREKK